MRTSKSVKHFKPYEAWNCMESLLTSESFASNWMLRQCFPTFRVAICQAIHACAGYLNDRSPWAWFHDVRCQGICVFSSRPPKKNISHSPEVWTAQETLETSGPHSPCSVSRHVWLFSCLHCTDAPMVWWSSRGEDYRR